MDHESYIETPYGEVSQESEICRDDSAERAYVGHSTCGKSWLLESLNTVYKTMPSPSPKANFCLWGLQDCSVIFFDDFRWNPTMSAGLSWQEFLLLGEGGLVDLNQPQNLASASGPRKVIYKVREL